MMCKMCTPMCASARVVSSNIVYLSTDFNPWGGGSVLTTKIVLIILSGLKL